AYGLRLDPSNGPFEFKRRRPDHLGLPTAWGPPTFAVLDHRDWMMEFGSHTGSSQILAVLNLYNSKVTALLGALSRAAAESKRRWELQAAIKGLRKALVVGRELKYDEGAGRTLVDALNSVGGVVAASGPRFDASDVPAYFDGGAV